MRRGEGPLGLSYGVEHGHPRCIPLRVDVRVAWAVETHGLTSGQQAGGSGNEAGIFLGDTNLVGIVIAVRN